MAGAGYKLFNTGDVLTAAQVNTYLNEQTVMVFASSAARTSALSGVLAEGMMSYLQDTNAVEVYNGTSWVNVGNAGDITEVQAGTGISVASGTGPIPVITNTVATAFDAAGDLVYGTGADTFTKLSLGTAGKVLTVNSGATAPEWAAPAGGGTWTQAATGSLTGASVTVSGLSGKEYYVFFLDFSHNSGTAEYMQLQLNGDTGNNYYDFGNATGISALLPCGNTTVAGNTERNGGCYIGMADTSMVYKPVLSLPPVSGSIGGQQGGWYGSSSAITSMTFFMSGGSFDAGTYYVWSFA